MFEKNLYTLCALLSLSCSAYAMEEKIYPTSVSIAGPSSSSDQGSSQFPHDKKPVTFTWSQLEQAARDSDQRARNLFDFLGYLIQEYGGAPDSVMSGDTNRIYTLPLLQEELSDNPPRQFCNGSLMNPLRRRHGKYSDVSIKIATIVGILPTTDALAELLKLTGSPLWLADDKMREMYLRQFVFKARHIIEEERKKATQEKAALLSELERLRVENKELRLKLQGVETE